MKPEFVPGEEKMFLSSFLILLIVIQWNMWINALVEEGIVDLVCQGGNIRQREVTRWDRALTGWLTTDHQHKVQE